MFEVLILLFPKINTKFEKIYFIILINRFNTANIEFADITGKDSHK